MPNKHLVKFILPEFIRILQTYEMSYYPIIATLTLNKLSNTKHSTAKSLLIRMKKLFENDDASVLNDANTALETSQLELTRSESRLSNLTMPSRRTQTSDWAATPQIRTTVFSQALYVSDEDFAPPTPAIAAADIAIDEEDSLSILTKILERERQKIHKARAGYKTGSFDGILYAMSRSLYFIKWFYNEIDIPVYSPDENVEDIERNQKYCLQLIWLIASYMCSYAYDRACKLWDYHHLYILKSPNYYVLDHKYYAKSGIASLPKISQEDMVKLDGYGNQMVNCISILSDIYLESDTNIQLSSLEFVTTVMLESTTMPIEYMDREFLANIRAIKDKLIAPLTPETVLRPNPLDMALFDSRNDENITLIDEDRFERLDGMLPSKIARTLKLSVDV
jgi:hypothetical protein